MKHLPPRIHLGADVVLVEERVSVRDPSARRTFMDRLFRYYPEREVVTATYRIAVKRQEWGWPSGLPRF